MILLVDEQLATADTDTTQDIENRGVELVEIDGTGKAVVAEVAGASVVGLAAGAARLSIVQNTHSGVKEATDFGFIALIGVLRCDFNNRTTLNLLGAENTELDSNDGFNFGTWSVETCGHLLFLLNEVSKPATNSNLRAFSR